MVQFLKLFHKIFTRFRSYLMSKRGSENAQQRREDFEAEGDDEDEPVDAGTFQKASADVLRSRRIVSVSDRFKARAAAAPQSAAPAPAIPTAATGTDDGNALKAVTVDAPDAPPPNPFAGFAALASSSSPPASLTGLAPDPAKPAAATEKESMPPNPFAGFNALTASASSPVAGAAAANPFAGFTGLCPPKPTPDEKLPAETDAAVPDETAQPGENGGDEDAKPDATAAPNEPVQP